jgi:hypothetical protein
MNEKINQQEVIINKLLVLLKNFINIDNLDIYDMEKLDILIQNNLKKVDPIQIDVKKSPEYISLQKDYCVHRGFEQTGRRPVYA